MILCKIGDQLVELAYCFHPGPGDEGGRTNSTGMKAPLWFEYLSQSERTRTKLSKTLCAIVK